MREEEDDDEGDHDDVGIEDETVNGIGVADNGVRP
jgi:hypothetical protein